MDFYDAIAKRRMVRNYEDRAVDAEVVDRIVAAGLRAPSAGFSQGVQLVVVTDADLRRQIAEIGHESHYVAEGFDPWISRAPVHIVVCVREESYHERYREPDKVDDDGTETTWPVPFWWVDAGAAMENILLATVAEGLAAGFLGSHALPELAALLGIPDDVAPVGIVTIGHPAPDRRSSSLDRGRRSTDQVVHRNGW